MEVLTSTSVLVSWSSGANIPNVQGYEVYYRPTQSGGSEGAMTVPNFSSSVTISGLRNGVEYQFQVAAMIVEGTDVIMGERSVLNEKSTITVSSQGKR